MMDIALKIINLIITDMKILKLFSTIFVFLATVNTFVLKGQTVHLYPVAILDHSEAWCIGKELTGQIVYHVTYHIDKKTGVTDRMHTNVLKADIFDSEDPAKKYIYIDTGSDDSGFSWEFWNETTMGGTNSFVYDQQSYNVPIGTIPAKGGNVWATFKLISPGGEKFTIHMVTRYVLDSGGNLVQVSNHENIDCAVW
jgi:hypothetical protein